MKSCTIALAMLLAGLGSAAHAQSLPTPKEFYFDEDKRAAPIAVVKGEGESLAAELVKERERGGRRALEATAQLAHVAYTDGRAELGKALYQQALTATQSDRSIGRSISWNYGWDLYRSGDSAGALGQWAELAGSSLGGPSWIPPTLALALWKLGRKDEAVRWYAAAVRTEPSQWAGTGQYAALLPDWSDDERATLAEVQTAWAANPPAWP